MRVLILLVAAALVAVQVAGHATFNSHAERDAYQRHRIQARRALQSKCSEKVKARRVRRAISEAASNEPQHPMLKARYYDAIAERASNASSSCILDPEVTQGPYHVLGEPYRQNITEGQAGIPITFKVSFVDIETCEPLKQAWVDVWQCNATGIYSGFIDASSKSQSSNFTGFPGVTPVPTSGAPAASSTPSYSDFSGPDGTNGLIAQNTTDNESFLRGIWRTDDDGLLTMYSIVPGYYNGRVTHTHLKVYSADDGEVAANGTFVAKGLAHHTGQWFYPQDFIEKISKMEPYSQNLVSYNDSVKNDEDFIFVAENADGNDAVMDLEYDENNIAAGVIATTYVGVNTTYASNEIAKSYWGGNSSSSSGSSSSDGSSSASDSSTASTSSSQSNSARRNMPFGIRLPRF